jgi:hypothetical protein
MLKTSTRTVIMEQMVVSARDATDPHVATVLEQMQKLLAVKSAQNDELLLLSGSEVNVALELMQRWMRQFMQPHNLNGVLICLLGYYQKYVGKEKEKKQSVAHQKASKEDVKEDSVAFFLMNTMYVLLRAAIEMQNHDSDKAFEVLDTSALGSNREFLLQFLVEKLASDNSAAIRNAAALCLSVLSLKSEFLSNIINQILSVMDIVASEEEEREFVSYQRAISDFAFGFGKERIDVTLEYLSKLFIKMKKIERGVLRQEICSSLKEIFRKLLDPADEILLQELDMMENSDRASEFWDLFSNIYKIVAKWSKKAKHMSFCYDLMSQMSCLGNKDFFKNPEVEDMLPLLVSGFKKSENKLTFMNYARAYIAELNVAFIREDPTKFMDQIRDLLSNIFPKKKV